MQRITNNIKKSVELIMLAILGLVAINSIKVALHSLPTSALHLGKDYIKNLAFTTLSCSLAAAASIAFFGEVILVVKEDMKSINQELIKKKSLDKFIGTSIAFLKSITDLVIFFGSSLFLKDLLPRLTNFAPQLFDKTWFQNSAKITVTVVNMAHVASQCTPLTNNKPIENEKS